MSHVSNALQRALGAIHTNQTALAQRAGIDRTMLNRYVKGSATLGAESLARLLEVLPVEHQAELTAAFARDWIPEPYHHLVTIEPSSGQVILAETPPVLPEELDAEFRDALLYLAHRGLLHSEIRDMVLRLASVLRGK